MNNMKSYEQSYTKEALFDKMIKDALN
ncbi:hypothetical protein V327_02517 [Staphylococcus aureus F29450_091412]|nr:hypothetical protein V327_02517 [Staphylococcus aureus F29450_091412]